MALGAAQQVTNAGVTPSYATPAASDSFAWPTSNPPVVWMHVKNANVAVCNVTVTSQASASDGLAKNDKPVAVPASTGDKLFRIGQVFKDADGNVAVAFDVQTSVSVGIFY
jgi:hypothetical protein